MAYTLTSDAQDSIELAEFVDYIEKNVDVTSAEGMTQAADISKKLYNNRNFLVEHVNNELKYMDQYQDGNPYSSMSLLLDTRDDFFVRVNFWVPVEKHAEQQKYDHAFIYGKPHCHNFDFLTIGYLGSGYVTEIYEYENGEVNGYPGESVDLRYLETTTLPEGKIMVYRKGKDVHTQSTSTEFSVSINIMSTNHGENMRQYFFDVDKKEITGQVTTGFREFLIRVAANIGDQDSLEILSDYVLKDHDSFTRLCALKGINKVQERTGEFNEILWEKASDDSNLMVRKYARSFLNNTDSNG